jgi:hypothetical protein
MEGCPDTRSTLSGLASLFRSLESNERKPALQEFHFRSDFESREICGPLQALLKSFSGLVFLSILLENCHGVPFGLDEEVMNTHGETLEVLVLESCDYARDDIFSHAPLSDHNETYSPDSQPGSQLSRMIRHYPNLVELSLCFA